VSVSIVFLWEFALLVTLRRPVKKAFEVQKALFQSFDVSSGSSFPPVAVVIHRTGEVQLLAGCAFHPNRICLRVALRVKR
jgi:ribosomal protein S12 methylthiotransferase accessory factor YcaO